MLVPDNNGVITSSTLVNVDSNGRISLDLNNSDDITKALDRCPPVNFIIGKKADAATQAEITVVNKKDDKPVKDSRANDFLQLIEKPNYIQTRNQFLTQILFNLDGYGWSVQLRNKGILSGEYSGTWVLPSELVKIEYIDRVNYKALYKNSILDLVKSVTFDGENINKEDIFIITSSNNLRHSVVIPVSPLYSARVTIENLITNFEGRGKLMDSPAFIISDAGNGANPQALGLKDGDQKEINRKLASSYGISEGKSKYIVTRANVNLQHISFPMSSMQFDVMEKHDVIQLAECLGYPPELLGVYGNANVSERESAEKSFYRRTVMPALENVLQQLAVAYEMPEQWEYEACFDHIEVLQKDKKLESEIFKNYVDSIITAIRSNLMKYGEGQVMLGVQVDEKNADKYYYQLPQDIKEGLDSKHKSLTDNNTNNGTA